MNLVVEIYEITAKFPKEELYNLTSQIRRASISIPSNIAEGKIRNSSKEFLRFLRIAFASDAELETQLELTYRLKYLSKNDYVNLSSHLSEVMKILNSFTKKIFEESQHANLLTY